MLILRTTAKEINDGTFIYESPKNRYMEIALGDTQNEGIFRLRIQCPVNLPTSTLRKARDQILATLNKHAARLTFADAKQIKRGVDKALRELSEEKRQLEKQK